MDDEKFQRAIDIILQNQAQFYADLQQVQETNKEIQDSQTKAEKRTNVLERACLNLYNISVKHDEFIDEQKGSLNKQTTNIDKLTADITELSKAQMETGERLNAVIFMAEKFFSGQ